MPALPPIHRHKESLQTYIERSIDRPMIEAEMKTAAATIRIHDEYCAPDPAQYLPQLAKIVTNSYKRRATTHPTHP